MRRFYPFIVVAILAASLLNACGRHRNEDAEILRANRVQAAEPTDVPVQLIDESSAPTLLPAPEKEAATIAALLDMPASQPATVLTPPPLPKAKPNPTRAPVDQQTPATDAKSSRLPIVELPTPTPDARISGTIDEEPVVAGGMPIGRVTAALMNVREGPSTRYGIAGQLQQSSELKIVGRNDDGSWLQVCCPFKSAEQNWISAELVDVQWPAGLAMEQLSVADPPPEPVAAAASVPAPSTGLAVGLPAPGGFPAPGSMNPLTGKPLPSGRNAQRPIVICINNDYAARPQYGLSQADVVYEYLMEGYGITRFSAIYYGSDAQQIGPVRSARLINYYMGALYDAGLACSGASDGVRYILKHQAPFPYMDVDLDDPSNTRYSTSIGSDYRTRLRTSTGGLRRWLTDWGMEKAPSIRGFTFGDTPGGGVSSTVISIAYPNGQAGFLYDGNGGRYMRSMSGAAHVDGNTGAQLALDNVIIQYVPHQKTDIVEDSLGSTSIRLDLFGGGKAVVFRDGKAYEGTWRSETRGDMPRFYDANGSEIALKPGRSWISVVPSGYNVSY